MVVVLLVLLVLNFSVSTADSTTITSEIESVEDIRVLAIIGNAFGWSYFELEEIFEGWGINFTTTGETEIVQSCYNRAPRPVEVDILVSEIDSAVISQFDVLIVPSGGHWQDLCSSQAVLDLINLADENGLVISGICTGIAPIADAGDVLNGTKVTGHGLARYDIHQSGAVMDAIKRVIRDGRIITGGPGGGPPVGYEYAPHYDLCLEIVRYLLGDTYLQEVSFGDIPDGKLIAVSTNSGDVLFADVATIEVEAVRAKIHPQDNLTDVKTYSLNITDVGGEFTGVMTDLEEGIYLVDLEIETINRTVEIHRNIAQFNYTLVESDLEIPWPLVLGISASGILIVTLIIYFRKHS